jgi:hypothetical protein
MAISAAYKCFLSFEQSDHGTFESQNPALFLSAAIHEASTASGFINSKVPLGDFGNFRRVGEMAPAKPWHANPSLWERPSARSEDATRPRHCIQTGPHRPAHGRLRQAGERNPDTLCERVLEEIRSPQ